ncbi:TPA: glycosyltransferase [Vibrio vulnificus]
MRVLNFSKYYPPYKGGIEKVAEDLTEGLINNSVDVSVLCFDSGEEASSQNCSIKRSATLANIKSTPISLKNINDYYYLARKSDIVHVHFPNPMANLSIFISWYFFRIRPKVIVHWHSDIVNQKYILILYKFLMNWLLKRSSSIVCTSQKYFESSKQLVNYKSKVEIIPIGIDTSHLKINLVVHRNLKKTYRDKFVVFSLGRHVYYKGFEWLIRAACYLDENVVVLIGGSGPLTNELKNLAETLNVSHKVTFLGRISDEDIGAYYSACDVFCMPSVERSEAFGVVQLEAMFFSKPIVSTRIEGSGVDWVNLHMESGLTVKTHDALHIATAINRLANDAQLYKDLSCGAKARFSKHFDSSVMSKSFIELYEKVVS